MFLIVWSVCNSSCYRLKFLPSVGLTWLNTGEIKYIINKLTDDYCQAGYCSVVVLYQATTSHSLYYTVKRCLISTCLSTCLSLLPSISRSTSWRTRRSWPTALGSSSGVPLYTSGRRRRTPTSSPSACWRLYASYWRPDRQTGRRITKGEWCLALLLLISWLTCNFYNISIFISLFQSFQCTLLNISHNTIINPWSITPDSVWGDVFKCCSVRPDAPKYSVLYHNKEKQEELEEGGETL